MPRNSRAWLIAPLIGVVLAVSTLVAPARVPAVSAAGTASVGIATFVCDPEIQTAADLSRAGGPWACELAVLPGDEPDLPDGYVATNLTTADYTYYLTTSAGLRAQYRYAALDGGGTCDPGTLTCTFGYSYRFDGLATGDALLELYGLEGYRPGAVVVTDGGEPPSPVGSPAVDLERGRIRLDLPAGNVYVQLVWFAGYRDVVGSPFFHDILWLAGEKITRGCGNFRFCPTAVVTRAQMAAFLVRALHLPLTSTDFFSDDGSSDHETDINVLAAAGIAGGCGPGRYCPEDGVTREQMASFLVRALELPPTTEDFFTDDEGSVHEGDINRLAAAGIGRGCAEARFCPRQEILRDQMAAFLRRALDP